MTCKSYFDTYIYILIHTYTHTHMYTYPYTHTYTHTPIYTHTQVIDVETLWAADGVMGSDRVQVSVCMYLCTCV